MPEALALVEDIPGWLRPGDAAKLYELAQGVDGPILEVGTFRGKSAILMALARSEVGREGMIFSLDVDEAGQRLAEAEARRRGVAQRIVFVHGTLEAFARAYPQMRPGAIFLDGDHTLEGVRRDLEVLERLAPAGGQLLFHDFADPRNEDPGQPETKVRPALERSWVALECEFLGTFGVCGLYQRKTEPLNGSSQMVDLMPLASAREQYLYRVRRPLAARLRRLGGRERMTGA
jgi:hypothetical protein